MAAPRCVRVLGCASLALAAACGSGGGGGGGATVLAGSLDPSFATGGALFGHLSGSFDLAADVAVQGDGKIVVVGTASALLGADFFAARFEPDGTPDVTFGFAGVRVIDFGGEDGCSSVAVAGDGKIVLAGSTNGGADDDFAIARLNSDGTPDTTFNGSGRLSIDVSGGNDDQASDVAVQPDLKIVVAGGAGIGVGSDFGVLRLDTLGVPDVAFAGTGFASHDFGGEDVAAALRRDPADGSFVVAGRTDVGVTDDFALCRFSSGGTFDAGFGDRFVDFGWNDAATDVQIQGDGKILVSGTDDGGLPDFAVARLSSGGVLDVTYHAVGSPTAYDGNGRISLTFGAPPFGGAEDGRRSLLLSDGRLVLVGRTDAGAGVSTNVGLARVTAAGELDATFDGDGKATYDFASATFEFGTAAAESVGGSIVVVGISGGAIVVFRVGG